MNVNSPEKIMGSGKCGKSQRPEDQRGGADDGRRRCGTKRKGCRTSEKRSPCRTAAGKTSGGFADDALGFFGKITASEDGRRIGSGLFQNKVDLFEIEAADIFHTVHSFLASVHMENLRYMSYGIFSLLPCLAGLFTDGTFFAADAGRKYVKNILKYFKNTDI